MATYAIIIVTYNSSKYIGPCLRSVQECLGEDAEIVVVDNGSQDETPHVCAAFPEVHFIANGNNEGFSKACNIGVANSKAPVIVLLNPDAMLTKNALPNMLQALRANEQIAVVGPLSNYVAGWQGIWFWYENHIISMHPNNRYFTAEYLQNKYAGYWKETRIIIGFCMMISRVDFNKFGGLDPELILGLDDLDLCWRVRLGGRKMAVVPSAFVFHAGHRSFDTSPKEMVSAMEKTSRQVFTHKLANHYGGVDKIPPSHELWEMNWFSLSKEESEAVGITKKNLDISPTTAFCLLVDEKNIELQNISLRGTIEQLFAIGVSKENILIIYPKPLAGVEKPAQVDAIQLAADTTYGELSIKMQRWFGERSVLILKSGLLVTEYFLDKVCKKSGLWSGGVRTLDGTTCREEGRGIYLQSSHSLLSLPYEWIFWGFGESTEGVPAWSDEFLQEMDWKLGAIQAGKKMAEQRDPLAVVKKSGEQEASIPAAIISHLQGCIKTGVRGKGQCLDLSGLPVQENQLDGLIYRLDPIEILGLSNYLRDLRNNGLNRIALVFDNCAMQQSGARPWPNNGILPGHVSRELLVAGFRVNKLIPWSEAEELTFSQVYGGRDASFGAVAPEDRLQAVHGKMIILATACSKNHFLEKKVSVVVLAINKLEYTQKCIRSLQENCRQSVELILIDNGSTDGTGDWFASIPGAKVIRNMDNLGVAAGWNQGLALATGDFVLILNNDTIIGPHCIENLVRCSINHPDAGIISPRSNQIAGPQLWSNFSFSQEKDIPVIAGKIQESNALSCWEFPRLKGFCMLIPRHIALEVGPFDEQFGLGNFEDDDYSCRVQGRGYQLLVADDSFLFHFGSVSFNQAGIDWNEQMRKNMVLFEQKWSVGHKAAWIPVHSKHWNPTTNIKVQGKEPSDYEIDILLSSGKLSEAEKILVERLGSTPTNAIVHYDLGRCLAAMGRHKEAFSQFCRSLELDSNQEKVAEFAREHLLQNFTAADIPEVMEYFHRRWPHLRAFAPDIIGEARSPAANWLEKVHGLLENKDWDQALSILASLWKTGERGFEVHNLLGIVRYQQGIYDEALEYFEAAIKLDPRNSDVLLNYYDCSLRLRIPEKAARAMEYALSLDSNLENIRAALQEIRATETFANREAEAIIYYRECNIAAENLIREGLTEKAESVLETILQEEKRNYRALNNMGLLRWYAGNVKEAWDYFHTSYRCNPWYLDAIVNLFDCAILSNRLAEFEPILAESLQLHPYNEDLLTIQQQMQKQIIPDRLHVYFRKQQEGHDLQKQVSCGQNLLEQGKLDSAVLLFTDLLERYPENTDCICGVGIAAFYRKQYDDAWTLFRHAIALKPLDKDALLNLYDVAPHVGKLAEARALLQNALAVDPGLQEIALALENEL